MAKDNERNRLLEQISQNDKRIAELKKERDALLEQYNNNTIKIEKMTSTVEEFTKKHNNFRYERCSD